MANTSFSFPTSVVLPSEYKLWLLIVSQKTSEHQTSTFDKLTKHAAHGVEISRLPVYEGKGGTRSLGHHRDYSYCASFTCFGRPACQLKGEMKLGKRILTEVNVGGEQLGNV